MNPNRRQNKEVEIIRYHGGPITPETAALAAWRRSHAMISFANPGQATLAFAVADSVAIDNGAWPIFAAGKGCIDVNAYHEFGADLGASSCIRLVSYPDIIDGSEEDNARRSRVAARRSHQRSGVAHARITRAS